MPLSPLSFALSVESFACAICQDPGIAGIPFGAQDHKLALYADDVLLTVGSPVQSLQQICHLLTDYERASGFKINLAKSEILNLTFPPEEVQTLWDCLPFQWNTDSLQYLGVRLTPTLDGLFQVNCGLCQFRFARTWLFGRH